MRSLSEESMEYQEFRSDALQRIHAIEKMVRDFPYVLYFAADRPNTKRVRDVHKAFGALEMKFWELSNFFCEHGPEVMKQLEKEHGRDCEGF